MKKQIAWIAGLCLALAGCAAPLESGTTAAETESIVTTAVTTEAASEVPDGPVEFSNSGKVRVEYGEGGSGVVYITDPSQLPDVEELKQFDEAYFENHALVLVTDTVGSGSTEIEIQKMEVRDGRASVTLKRTTSGDVGTCDMATWLLWAEVEPGMELTWEVANPGISDNSVSK